MKFSVDALPAASDHFPDSLPRDLGSCGTNRRSQSVACSCARLSASHDVRHDHRRPLAVGNSYQSAASAPGIYLWLSAGNWSGPFGRLVSAV